MRRALRLVCFLVGHSRYPDDASRYERTSHTRCSRCHEFVTWEYWNLGRGRR